MGNEHSSPHPERSRSPNVGKKPRGRRTSSVTGTVVHEKLVRKDYTKGLTSKELKQKGFVHDPFKSHFDSNTHLDKSMSREYEYLMKLYEDPKVDDETTTNVLEGMAKLDERAPSEAYLGEVTKKRFYGGVYDNDDGVVQEIGYRGVNKNKKLEPVILTSPPTLKSPKSGKSLQQHYENESTDDKENHVPDIKLEVPQGQQPLLTEDENGEHTLQMVTVGDLNMYFASGSTTIGNWNRHQENVDHEPDLPFNTVLDRQRATGTAGAMGLPRKDVGGGWAAGKHHVARYPSPERGVMKALPKRKPVKRTLQKVVKPDPRVQGFRWGDVTERCLKAQRENEKNVEQHKHDKMQRSIHLTRAPGPGLPLVPDDTGVGDGREHSNCSVCQRRPRLFNSSTISKESIVHMWENSLRADPVKDAQSKKHLTPWEQVDYLEGNLFKNPVRGPPSIPSALKKKKAATTDRNKTIEHILQTRQEFKDRSSHMNGKYFLRMHEISDSFEDLSSSTISTSRTSRSVQPSILVEDMTKSSVRVGSATSTSRRSISSARTLPRKASAGYGRDIPFMRGRVSSAPPKAVSYKTNTSQTLSTDSSLARSSRSISSAGPTRARPMSSSKAKVRAASADVRKKRQSSAGTVRSESIYPSLPKKPEVIGPVQILGGGLTPSGSIGGDAEAVLLASEQVGNVTESFIPTEEVRASRVHFRTFDEEHHIPVPSAKSLSRPTTASSLRCTSDRSISTGSYGQRPKTAGSKKHTPAPSEGISIDNPSDDIDTVPSKGWGTPSVSFAAFSTPFRTPQSSEVQKLPHDEVPAVSRRQESYISQCMSMGADPWGEGLPEFQGVHTLSSRPTGTIDEPIHEAKSDLGSDSEVQEGSEDNKHKDHSNAQSKPLVGYAADDRNDSSGRDSVAEDHDQDGGGISHGSSGDVEHAGVIDNADEVQTSLSKVQDIDGTSSPNTVVSDTNEPVSTAKRTPIETPGSGSNSSADASVRVNDAGVPGSTQSVPPAPKYEEDVGLEREHGLNRVPSDSSDQGGVCSLSSGVELENESRISDMSFGEGTQVSSPKSSFAETIGGVPPTSARMRMKSLERMSPRNVASAEAALFTLLGADLTRLPMSDATETESEQQERVSRFAVKTIGNQSEIKRLKAKASSTSVLSALSGPSVDECNSNITTDDEDESEKENFDILAELEEAENEIAMYESGRESPWSEDGSAEPEQSFVHMKIPPLGGKLPLIEENSDADEAEDHEDGDDPRLSTISEGELQAPASMRKAVPVSLPDDDDDEFDYEDDDFEEESQELP